jgi:Transcription factor/nuclear export subunit protein 2
MTKILATIKELTEEHEAQKRHVDQMKAMISSMKDGYFVPSSNVHKVSEALLQTCVYHRVLMSPLDAMFCSQVRLFSTYPFMLLIETFKGCIDIDCCALSSSCSSMISKRR